MHGCMLCFAVENSNITLSEGALYGVYTENDACLDAVHAVWR